MSRHSIAEAKERLSELIDRARRGEEVVITEDDRPVAALKPLPAVETKPRALSLPQVTQDDIDWLDSHRVGRLMPKEDAGTFVSRMRDEDWNR